MKWLLVSLGVVFGLAALSAAIGWLLPKHHIARVEARYDMPPEAIWATLSDLSSWPSWNPHIKSIERLPDQEGKAVWLVSDKSGKLPSRVEQSIAPSADRDGLLVTAIDDPSLPFGGTWTWNVERMGAQTRVRITEDGEIRNPIFRLMARWFFDPHETATQYLRALGAKHGQTVEVSAIK